MIKEELYKRTTDILYQAYFDNTLAHSWCAACAVGNMVAANCGYRIYKKPAQLGFGWDGVPDPVLSGWPTVFITMTGWDVNQKINPHNYAGVAKMQIDSTGYTWPELAQIEYAFETADKGESKEDHMFNGLVKVLEVLKDIHQVTDEDLIQGNNKRFKDQYIKRTEKVSTV